MKTLSEIINKFTDKHGGYWAGEHPAYTVAMWQQEVQNGDTRVGYWEWAWRQVECEE